jgi:hypothetical protein
MKPAFIFALGASMLAFRGIPEHNNSTKKRKKSGPSPFYVPFLTRGSKMGIKDYRKNYLRIEK